MIEGICKVCGEPSISGDNLCLDCWDDRNQLDQYLSLYSDSKKVGGNGKLLTKTELIILNYASLGFNNKSIAERMFIEIKTLEHHWSSIYQKIIAPSWSNKRVWIAINTKELLAREVIND